MIKLTKKIIQNLRILGILFLVSMPNSSYAWPPGAPDPEGQPRASYLSLLPRELAIEAQKFMNPGKLVEVREAVSNYPPLELHHPLSTYQIGMKSVWSNFDEAKVARYRAIIEGAGFVVHPKNYFIHNGKEVDVEEFEVATTMITQEQVVEYLGMNPTLVWNGVGSVWMSDDYHSVKKEDCPKYYEEMDVGEIGQVDKFDLQSKTKKVRNLVSICRGHAANYISPLELEVLVSRINEVARNVIYQDEQGRRFIYQYDLPTREQLIYYVRSMNPETKEVIMTDYSFGNEREKLKDHAVFWDDSIYPRIPVRSVYQLKTKLPNPMGLYDTYGTLTELGKTLNDKFGYHIVGGSWLGNAESCRSLWGSTSLYSGRLLYSGGRFVRTKVFLEKDS